MSNGNAVVAKCKDVYSRGYYNGGSSGVTIDKRKTITTTTVDFHQKPREPQKGFPMHPAGMRRYATEVMHIQRPFPFPETYKDSISHVCPVHIK